MPEIVVEQQDDVSIVRLNRPDRGNSVTPAVVTELGDTVAALCAEKTVRAIVITGTGKVFCAGADVQEMYDVYRADGADGLMNYLADTWMPAVQRTVRKLWAATKPTVAAFNGAATAGGLDFGLTCDTRIAAETARFAESYVNLGMVPVAGGVYLVPALVGLPTATALLATGRLIGAPEARHIGLVDEICVPGELIDQACKTANELCHGPGETFARAKRALRLAATADLEAALEESLRANIDLIAQGEVRDRMVAVMERFADQ
jgi:enoyl-CoA hydratase/carnithine racemase